MYDLYFNIIYIIFIYFLLFFIVGTIIKNNSIVDIGWGMGFFILSLYLIYLNSLKLDIKTLTNILVLIWGFRLSYHILKRNKKEEDKRYKKWREEWGDWVVLRAFFQVYLLQGLFMFLIFIPVIIINNAKQIHENYYVISGFVVWTIGFLFESISDYQLKVFKEDINNKGKFIKSGLWKYSRHPNYFGESCMWFGISLIAYFATKNINSFISPIIITCLLLFVSGIPLLEKSFEKREGFLDYKEKTSIFIPWFPKS
ncbi:MAG: DUF1295 domain-containing protein [Peptostreptococcaceae bacterium]|jgi:steroid 5-alpha reductase family enzyme|nr:DUF1295 domain-containing protein [Peptostreptococcaceae bacterium]